MKGIRMNKGMSIGTAGFPKLMLVLMATVLVLSSCKKDPVACFNPNRFSIIPGKFVTFFNCSSEADSYKWDFGDGNTSIESSPFNGYASKGTYSVSLEATNNAGDIDTKVSQVFVGDPGPFQLVIDSIAFPAQDALSILIVELDGEELVNTSVTPFELPLAIPTPVDKVWPTTTTNVSMRVVTDLDDFTVTFNPHTASDADLLVRLRHVTFWSGYVVLTGR